MAPPSAPSPLRNSGAPRAGVQVGIRRNYTGACAVGPHHPQVAARREAGVGDLFAVRRPAEMRHAAPGGEADVLGAVALHHEDVAAAQEGDPPAVRRPSGPYREPLFHAAVGEGPDHKAAHSDALKRAAVHLGIGDCVYRTEGSRMAVGDGPQRLRCTRRGRPYLDDTNAPGCGSATLWRGWAPAPWPPCCCARGDPVGAWPSELHRRGNLSRDGLGDRHRSLTPSLDSRKRTSWPFPL
jgi:hypothetical protein